MHPMWPVNRSHICVGRVRTRQTQTSINVMSRCGRRSRTMRTHRHPPRPPRRARVDGRVDHDREFVEVVLTDRPLRRTWLPTVRVSTRVDRDRTLPDARTLPGLIVRVDVEHDLVTVDIRVVHRPHHATETVAPVLESDVGLVVDLRPDILSQQRSSGQVQIPLAVRRVLQQLPEPAEVPQRALTWELPLMQYARNGSLTERFGIHRSVADLGMIT